MDDKTMNEFKEAMEHVKTLFKNNYNQEFEDEMLDLYQQLPGASVEMTRCPIYMGDGRCGNIENLADIIIHLNDEHKWPREQIADWLEKFAEDNNLDITFKEKYALTENSPRLPTIRTEPF